MAFHEKNATRNNITEKITIEDFRELYFQNLKGSFFRNDAVKRTYTIEGTICSDIKRFKTGTSFKIQSEDGNIMNVYIPKKSDCQPVLEIGNKISLFGMFNLYEKNISSEFDFIEFKASKIINSTVSDSKKESILYSLNEKGFLDKQKKNLNFENLEFFKLAVISSKSSNTSSEINKYLTSNNFFEVSMHYIDTYLADEISNAIKSIDKNNYYDAILITGVDSCEKRLFDEFTVLESVLECKTPVISAIGDSITDEVADIKEESSISAARMLHYEYRDYRYSVGEPSDQNGSIHNSGMFITLNEEKEKLERILSSVSDDKLELLAKIRSQQKIMLVLCFIVLILLIVTIVT